MIEMLGKDGKDGKEWKESKEEEKKKTKKDEKRGERMKVIRDRQNHHHLGRHSCRDSEGHQAGIRE